MGQRGKDAKSPHFTSQVLQNVEWPEQFPFKDEDFQRFDESPDSLFYEAPHFVTRIDDPAIASEVFPPSNTPGVSILDMCSSWEFHFYLQAVDITPNPGRSDPMYIVYSWNLSPA
ncbi:uncharacterized protein LOC111284500 [Durio zibethinus]|uniref:Uncharacterized protein LOC111284500 n=1 Tax=Durio zibethinus TaxID=66656 RepID=A0A6P5XKJ0_DURZI|nr:uncharacterized protein LOC111284500 [Durio zibethinus]